LENKSCKKSPAQKQKTTELAKGLISLKNQIKNIPVHIASGEFNISAFRSKDLKKAIQKI